MVAAGATPRGTKPALAALMKAIQVEGKSAFVPAGLDVSGKPAFAKRGMHFNGWAFNAPYSFRNWSEEDWKRYLDILAYQGVNLFYLWPFIEIMPVPLSPEDRAYLEECRRVVDYAQKKHGMEVWIMQCTNRVAKDRCGVADPRRRPYWRPSQEDLNPGKPERFQGDHGLARGDVPHPQQRRRRLQHRFRSRLLPRQSVERLRQGAARLPRIARPPQHPRQANEADQLDVERLGTRAGPTRKTSKLINGEPSKRLKKGLPEPWGLIAGWGRACSRSAARKTSSAKTVLLPYGVIEGEPSYPATNLQIDAIRPQFDRVRRQVPGAWQA